MNPWVDVTELQEGVTDKLVPIEELDLRKSDKHPRLYPEQETESGAMCHTGPELWSGAAEKRYLSRSRGRKKEMG